MVKKIKLRGLSKSHNLKIRHELLDQDYIDKLTPSEKKWLNGFNEEYISANFEHEGKRVHPVKVKTKVVKSTGKKKKVDLMKKDCQDRNNRHNRDAFAVTRSNNILKGEQHIGSSTKTTKQDAIEDAIIALIDGKTSKRRRG